jgi:peroxiredoxin
MNRFVFLLLLLPVIGLAEDQETKPAPTPEETTLTTVGQLAPDFTVATLDGGSFTLGEQRGKVVLINWFATWCPPCQAEMPHLQKEVWEEFAGDDFVMVSVARQEKADVVAPFVKKYAVTWPFALDPDRIAYARYAEAFIPRNHVIDSEGRIIFQSEGFEEADFEEMIKVIAAELAKK